MASDLKPMDAQLLKLKNEIQQLANTNDSPPLKVHLKKKSLLDTNLKKYLSSCVSLTKLVPRMECRQL